MGIHWTLLLLTMGIPYWSQSTQLLMTSSFQQESSPCSKAHVISSWFDKHNIDQSNPIRHLWAKGGTEGLLLERAADKSAANTWSNHINMDKNL